MFVYGTIFVYFLSDARLLMFIAYHCRFYLCIPLYTFIC